MSSAVDRVVIGMDPRKRSVTIEVMTGDETILGGGRYATDTAGYQAMLRDVAQWRERVWAIEGCSGIGHHVANRLLADGERVVDVPPKLSARTRVFGTGQGRKTDATDVHSVALVGTRMAGLRPVVNDEQQRRAREGNREATLTPARPAHIPMPALRTGHCPDPSAPSLRPRSRPLLDTERSQMRATGPRLAS
jgi:Transposase